MVRSFQYRFYPSPEQKVALAKTFGCVRFVYNWGLNLRKQAWEQQQKRVSYEATSAALTSLKRQPGLEWLNEVSCVPVQQSLRHLQTAFVNFWRHGKGFPTFKTKFSRQSAEFTRSGFEWRHGVLELAKIGRLKIRFSRAFESQPSTITVSLTASGRYYVTFRIDEPIASMAPSVGTLGIDLGLLCFAACSDENKYDSPRPLRGNMDRLNNAKKSVERKQKGSANRTKARVRLAKIHQKIKDIRQDALHKLSTKLVRENQTLVIEDLNVTGMMANHSLAGAIADSAWSEFVRQLEYKCAWYGRTLIRIDRFYPSSKLCSTPDCGFKNDSMPMRIREWVCPSCGVTHDRDINAAINILRAGLGPNSLPSEPCSNAAGNRNQPPAKADGGMSTTSIVY